MNFSLIVCTYMRLEPLLKLLSSVELQTQYPDEILVVDGSTDDKTREVLKNNPFKNLQYFKVTDKDRGLTKQRNYGISKVGSGMEVVCFLDDDTILEIDYFERLIETYSIYPDALGVGGYITNEVRWMPANSGKVFANEFYFDGWKRKDGSRFVLRKKMGLDSDVPPAYLPKFAHGRSVSFLPPSGEIYQVEQFMGGVSSFKKHVFENFSFSTYFVGYGLYEDADFTLRLSKVGKLYVNTAARLSHHHEASGRPNHFLYGKMVVRNGWYVWRVKHPKPGFKNKIKWHVITFLLMLIRFSNGITSKNRKAPLLESFGRFWGWLSLWVNRPLSKRSV